MNDGVHLLSEVGKRLLPAGVAFNRRLAQREAFCAGLRVMGGIAGARYRGGSVGRAQFAQACGHSMTGGRGGGKGKGESLQRGNPGGGGGQGERKLKKASQRCDSTQIKVSYW